MHGSDYDIRSHRREAPVFPRVLGGIGLLLVLSFCFIVLTLCFIASSDQPLAGIYVTGAIFTGGWLGVFYPLYRLCQGPRMRAIRILTKVHIALMLAISLLHTFVQLVMVIDTLAWNCWVALAVSILILGCNLLLFALLTNNPKNTLRIAGLIALGILLLAGFVAILFAIFSSGKSGFAAQGICIGIVLAGILAYALASKKGALAVFALAGLVYYYTLYICAMNGFPEFIRKIPGKDFLSIFSVFAACCVGAALVFGWIVSLLTVAKNHKHAVSLRCSDSDLMLLQGFSRFRLRGYFLLKAKLHNVLSFYIVPGTEESVENTMVDINPQLSAEALEEYCQANPLVQKIVAFIQSAKQQLGEDSHVEIDKIIRELPLSPTWQSECGIFVSTCTQKARSLSAIFFWCGVVASYTLGILKLMMGVYNGKEISNLLMMLLFLAPIVLSVVYLFPYKRLNDVILDGLTRKVVTENIAKFHNAPQQYKATDFNGTGMSNEKTTLLLRAYAVHGKDEKAFPLAKDHILFADAIFTAAAAAEAAEAAAKAAASSSSGCSSCGGCGGCGSCGGCGGCGGCGD